MSGAAAWRGLGFLGLWLVLAGPGAAGLLVGLPAAALAAWTSLRLLPPAGRGLRPWPALRLAGEVMRASVTAGLDIAFRALDPRGRVRPCEVAVPLRLPPGPARDGFRLLASLQPGTLPAGLDAEGRLVVHALDAGLPVAVETRAAETLFAAAAGHRLRHG
ncbi:Na+/H+ antiporter subunit E [Dankookia sp. P2]|uniref:Na+/H+ antiporter subunit E n=1 Tax=Dankookia sp. P2 TaxID=3423955 RepID=UPI003D67513C